MGTLNSMKAECSPLGVLTQDQFTIQSPHSAHPSQSDQFTRRIEIDASEEKEKSLHKAGTHIRR